MKNNKLVYVSIAVIIVLLVVNIIVSAGGNSSVLGNKSNSFWDGVQGFKIDGTTIVDSSRNFTGVALTLTGETQAITVVSGGTADATLWFATTTATAAQMCNYSYAGMGLASDPVATLTLPATTTLHADCLGANGKTKSILISDNATGTLAMTIVAGAGIELMGDDNSSEVLAEDSIVRLDFLRISTATTVVTISPFLATD